MNLKNFARPEDASLYLEAIFKTATDAIITINEKGIVETMNPAAESLFGFNESEVVGNNVSMLMSSPDRERHDSYLSNYLHTGEKKIIGIGREVNGLRKDGQAVPLRLAVSETVVNGKRIFTGILHDLTEVKEAQEKVNRLNKELEVKVRKRTEELTSAVNKLLDSNAKLQYENQERRAAESALLNSEKELRKSLEKEKELSQLKSRFVTMASHEFRTPLSAILSSADLIELYTKSEPSDKRLKHVERIKSSVQNLTSILNDFLSLSKLEEKRVNIKFVQFSVKDFCEEVTDEIKGLFKPGQKLRHLSEIEDIEIILDKKILKNILFNLLSNAIKYSPDGKEILCNVMLENEKLKIDIIDNGIGIPEEDQQYLFTRFFRAQNAENIQGTGLGLNIVRKYLDLLDGSINFESKVGVGTTFKIEIPCQVVTPIP